jgi:TPR repeat protein
MYLVILRYELGLIYESGDPACDIDADPKKAFDYFLIGVSANHNLSWHATGYCHWVRPAVHVDLSIRPSYFLPLTWMSCSSRTASHNVLTASPVFVSILCFNPIPTTIQNGIGTPHNDVEAITCWKTAAHLGVADAQYQLGWLYQHGYLPLPAAPATSSVVTSAAASLSHALTPGDGPAPSIVPLLDPSDRDLAKAIDWYALRLLIDCIFQTFISSHR